MADLLIGNRPSSLHQERLNVVQEILVASDVKTVLDLGCGRGPLMVRLAQTARFDRLVGVDISTCALHSLDRKLASIGSERCKISLIRGSFMDPTLDLSGFDAAIMVETIEHIAPERLASVEGAVFRRHRPRTVVITTPNRDWNDRLGVPKYRYRHRDHRFEWGRLKFRSWAERLATRNRYRVCFQEIGQEDIACGGASQMACFSLIPHDQ
ncbi:methyltransferase domain-containing protein [Nitrobacter winogradskyi]|uniref:SAM-dependent methyltransferase n=1 Tax=Nitrobacter winogradskyi TaxID=913 RepID=A0ACC6AIQ1_NITWI|nr:methyltransferase domain-containing protein [Nitrobacter winogradskyi]MCP1999628.1 SAM-dependent methyltransferase [Nitrobacter winogradskyi]